MLLIWIIPCLLKRIAPQDSDLGRALLLAISDDAETNVLALGGSNLITKPERSVYAISAASRTSGVFSIGKEYLPDQAYNAGMSAETIMDLSALPFTPITCKRRIINNFLII